MSNLSKEEERQVLLLSALLHDIGKLVQRANEKPSAKTHSLWGADWFIKTRFSPHLLPEHLKSPIESLICNHHEDSSPLPHLARLFTILKEADYLSAGERPEKEDPSTDERGRWNSAVPLCSILTEVHLEGKPSPQPSYWELQPLTSSFIAPKPRHSATASRVHYERILNEINEKMPKISSVSSLLALLEKNLTFVPSETREVLNEDGSINTDKDPDISLYDHLKLTCAIALCLYDAEESPEFLLVRGDISGVQNFIYTISSKGALKGLRARSFYIELLSNHIPALILDELALPPANLIFCGGAHFTLLLPNNSKTEEVLERIKKKVNEWLWNEFRGKLYLALRWLPVSKEELSGEGVMGKQEELSRLIEEDKLRKFADVPQLFQPQEIRPGICKDCNKPIYECDVCGSSSEKFKVMKVSEERHLHLCQLCDALNQIGGIIPKMEKPCVVAVPEGDIHLPLASYKLVEKKELSGYLSQSERIFLLDSEPEEAPPHPHIYFLQIARYIKRDKNGEAYDFEGFAKAGLGAERVGILRLDVDNLGKIMGEGLKIRYSFSRIATLSRFLTIFFKNFMDDILRGKNLAVVYSGGDDAFVVGAWNEVLESAFEIHEKFSRFTNNPSFTISAGYLTTYPKDPLYQMARRGGELEERAKESGRDRFAMFFSKKEGKFREEFKKEPTWEECYRIKGWKEEILDNYAELRDGHYELKLPRSLLYRLLEISRAWQEGEFIYPYIYLVYILGKIKESLAKKDKELGERWHNFAVENLLVRENIPHFVQLVYWIDLLVREKEKGGES